MRGDIDTCVDFIRPSLLETLGKLPLHRHMAATSPRIASLWAFRRAKTLAGQSIDYAALAVEAIGLSSFEQCFAAFEAMTSAPVAARIIYLIHDGATKSPWLEGGFDENLTADELVARFNAAQYLRDRQVRAETLPRKIMMVIIALLLILAVVINFYWQ